MTALISGSNIPIAIAGSVPAAGQSMILHHIMEKASCRAAVHARRSALPRLITRTVTPAVKAFSILQIHWPIRILLVPSPVHHPGTPADDPSWYQTQESVLETSAEYR